MGRSGVGRSRLLRGAPHLARVSLQGTPPGWLDAFTEEAMLIPVPNTPTGYALSDALLKMRPAPWCVRDPEI